MPDPDVLMPFGKHKGRRISELPIKYCEWLNANATLYGDVDRAVKARLGMPMIVSLTEDEKIDRIVCETIDRLQEAIEEMEEFLG